MRDLKSDFEGLLVPRAVNQARNRWHQDSLAAQLFRLLRAEKPNIIGSLLNVFLETQSHYYWGCVAQLLLRLRFSVVKIVVAMKITYSETKKRGRHEKSAIVWRRIIVFCGSWKPSGLASHMMSVIVNLERAVVRNLQLSTASEMHLERRCFCLRDARWPNERNCSSKKLNCSLKIQLNPHAIGRKSWNLSFCWKMETNGSRLRLRKSRLRT